MSKVNEKRTNVENRQQKHVKSNDLKVKGRELTLNLVEKCTAEN